MPKRHHSGMDPVTQSHQAETSGDLCQRKGPLANRTEPGTWCQHTRGLPVTPTHMVNWEGTNQSQLVEARGRGWDWPWLKGDEDLECLPQLEAFLQELLGWGEASLDSTKAEDGLPPHQHQCPMIQSPSPVPHGVDRVACQTCPDTTLVGGTCEDPQPEGLPAVCQEGACLLWGAKRHAIRQSGWKMITHPTVTPFYWEILFPATERWEVRHSGLLTHSVTPHDCLYECATILGWEGPTTSSWPTSLSCRKCDKTWVSHGGTGIVYWRGGFCDPWTIQLDGVELAQADGAQPTRSPSLLWS